MTYKAMFPDSRSKDEIYAPVTPEMKKLVKQVIEDKKELLEALKASGD